MSLLTALNFFQGYNRVIVFSRPFYFCVCAMLVLALHYASIHWSGAAFTLYGLPLTSYGALVFARDMVKSKQFDIEIKY